MKGFLAWFKGSTKLKRWIFFILIGIILSCFGFANILVTDEMTFQQMAKIVVIFVLGFTMVIVGLIFIQKRTLELLIEADAVNKPKDDLDIRSLIFNKNVYDKGPNIVVIGGGSGLNSILTGIKKYTSNVTAIVTTSDYGELVVNPNLIPLADIKRGFIGLASDKEAMKRILNYKFENNALSGTTFAELYVAVMKEIHGNLADSVEQSNKILNITGRVLPVTIDGMNICVELKDGTVIREKGRIRDIVGEKVSPISRVFVNPTNARPAHGVIEAIQNADAIIIGPGSLYMNVLPNLLIKGVASAVKESKALKVYVSNIMTEPGQTDDYSVDDHINAIFEHLGKGMIDFCICDTGDVAPEYIRRYNLDGADVLEQDFQKVKERGIQVIKKDLAKVENGYVRHDSEILASTIVDLLCTDLRFKNRENDAQYILLNTQLKEGKRHEKVKDNNRKQKQKMERKHEKKAENKNRTNRFKKESKFSEKYKNRIESIQATEEQRIKNRLQYEIKNRKKK